MRADARVANRQERAGRLIELLAEAEALAASAQLVPAGDQGRIQDMASSVRALQARWRTEAQGAGTAARSLRPRFQQAMDAAYAPVAASREAEYWQRMRQQGDAVEMTAQVERPGQPGRTFDQGDQWGQGRPPRLEAAWVRCPGASASRRLLDWPSRPPATGSSNAPGPISAEQDALREANLVAKRALLAEAETLAKHETIGLVGSPADIAMRRADGERVRALQQERWRGIGMVPREHDRELFRAFRSACDVVFGHLREQDAAKRQE